MEKRVWPTSLGPGVQFPSGVANWCLDHKERRSLCSFFPGGVFFPTRQSPSRLETQTNHLPISRLSGLRKDVFLWCSPSVASVAGFASLSCGSGDWFVCMAR